MLGAFKNSPITAMEIEAGILPVSIKFEKICKNYALRILKMQENHSIKLRISVNSPFSNQNNGINLASFNNIQLAEWNQPIEYSESESKPESSS